VPLVPGIQPEPRAARALEQAQRTRFRRAAWRVAAGVVGAFGLLSVAVALLALLLVSPGPLATLLTLLTVAVPLGVSAHAWRRATKIGRELGAQLDEAWRFTLLEVLRTRTSSDPEELELAELAGALGIGEERAEALLAELEVHDLATSAVGRDGVMRYRALAGPRRRIAVDDLGLSTQETSRERAAEPADEEPEPTSERRDQRA
jgi:hypothetical protein